MLDYYSVLGVKPVATREEIRAAYHAASRIYHPDRNVDRTATERQWAEERFKQVNAAWQVLRDPQRRAQYDSTRNATPASAGNVPRQTPAPPPAATWQPPVWPTAEDMAWAKSILERYAHEENALLAEQESRRRGYRIVLLLSGLLIPVAAFAVPWFLGLAGNWPSGVPLPSAWRTVLFLLLGLELLAVWAMMDRAALSLDMRAILCVPCHVFFVYALSFIPAVAFLSRLGLTQRDLLVVTFFVFVASHVALGYLVAGRELDIWAAEEIDNLHYRFEPLLRDAEEILVAA